MYHIYNFLSGVGWEGGGGGGVKRICLEANTSSSARLPFVASPSLLDTLVVLVDFNCSRLGM